MTAATAERSSDPIPDQAVKPYQVTDLERAEILRLRQTEGLSIRRIAELIGRSTNAVSRALEDLEQEEREVVANLLKLHGKAFVADWQTAATIAARDGDHKPARDGLLYAQHIDPLADTSAKGSVAVQVIIGMPGQPAGPDPLAISVTHE